MNDRSLFDRVGGRPTLARVHKKFYDKIYEHPWLKRYFDGVDQELIENQQTDFMTSSMGGGKIYCGKIPERAHNHMFVTAEMFDLRTRLLKESIAECGVPDDLSEMWLRIDSAFKHSIVKKDPGECKRRYHDEEVINIPKP